MANTKIFDWDVANGAGIKTDKLTDSGQGNKFVTQAEKDALVDLTSGGNADSLHWHSGFGALAIHFGRNALVMVNQFLEINGVPSNLCGALMTQNGYALSMGVNVGEVISGSALKIELTRNNASFPTPVIITIPAGNRKAVLQGLDETHPFNQLDELGCRIIQGYANRISALVEIRWR